MAIVDDTGTLVAQYEYDSFGKTTVKDASGSIPSSNLFVGNINPFRWKSFYYDVETNFYYANGRYYEVERGGYIDAIEADVVEGNAYSLLGLDRNGIMLLTLLMLAPYSETIATALQLYADPTYNLNTGEEESWWKKHWWEVLVSAVSIVVGVVKIATGNPTGILNILSGITTLVGAIFSQQLAGAMGTAMLGVQTIMIGVQSLSCNLVYGIIAMAVGAACVAFATAEAQESLGYGNWLKDTVGMSDEVYKGVMVAVNVAAIAINIVGVKQCFKEGTLVACLNENGEEVRKPIGVLTRLNKGAFDECNKLVNVTIPDDLTIINAYTFNNCNSLTSVMIPDRVTSIGDAAFSSCNKLATINLPNEVNSIGYYAFYNCSSLTSIIIPESIEYIGDCAFDGCSNLKYNEDTNGYYLGNGSNPFVYLINIKNTDIVDYTINESTKIIGDSAFSGCSNLVKVTLGNNLRCIGSSAFEDSKGLSEVYIMDIGSWCKISFGDRYSNPIAYNAKLYLNNVLLTDLIVPDGITVIKNYAFYNYDSLISVELPIGVTGIGDYAFYDCDNLTSVALLQGSMSIGNYAFYECVNLTRVTIPAGATSVGDYAFYYCGLEKMIFSDNATSVGTYAFYCCQDLTNVTFPNSLESIGSYSFGFCTSLTRVEIPDSVTRSGTYAFAWCKALTSVTIGNGLEKIEDYAFLDCIKLTSVKIGNNVTSIGKYAFSGCALQIVEIPKSVTYIGTYAFDGCSGLERVVLENTSGWKCYRGNTLIADLPYGQSAWFALALKDTNAYSDCKWLRS